jgi:hypothetical protein
MIQVSVGGADEFNALVYGQKHPGTIQFLENQVSNFSNTLTEAGKSFFSNMRNVYEQFNGENAMRLAKAAVRKAGSLFQRDEIRDIWELGEMQQAPLTMQRFIMANPKARERFHNQLLDGYSDTYVDIYPDKIGTNHYDFRRATTGMVMDDEENDWVCRTFVDDLVEGDRELSFTEKKEIANTWDAVEFLLDGLYDPTSTFNSKL